jgi:hypothetical protein
MNAKDIESLQDILKEYVGNTYYPAKSDAPRKDFTPAIGQKGYTVPYQADILPSNPDDTPPANSSTTLWPMQSISEDIADSYVYLYAATLKMNDCIKQNAALRPEQKKLLREIFKICKILNKTIMKIGCKMDKEFNLSNMVDSSSKI